MIEDYFQDERFREELRVLRELLLKSGLQETFKWRAPCYTARGGNIALLGRLKDHVVLSFPKGALINDEAGVLEQPGENTRSARVIRLKSVEEVNQKSPIIERYIRAALEIEKSGKRVPKSTAPLELPEELKVKFESSKPLKEAFEKLTPGRQRGYCLYFSSAKTSKARNDRIERYTGRILDGKGFHDCVCGLSKKMPNCDGSHKHE